MKKILFTFAAMLMIAASTNAQTKEDYNKVYVGFNAESMKSMKTAYGANIGYAHAFNITGNKAPLFLELGAEINYLHAKTSNELNLKDVPAGTDTEIMKAITDYINKTGNSVVGGVTESFSMLNLVIPANITYHIGLGNSGVSLAPFVGVNFKFNVMSKVKEDYDILGYNNGTSYNLLKENTYFSPTDTKAVKVFQLGMNAGLNVYYNDIMIGYRYQPDFTEYHKYELLGYSTSIKTTTHVISVGYRF